MPARTPATREKTRVIEDEELLMAVLNSRPIIDGSPQEHLDGTEGRDITNGFGGTASALELTNLRHVRDALQRAIRTQDDPQIALTAMLSNTVLTPQVTPAGVRWELQAPADENLAARTILAWSRAQEELPGRLRPCANTDCNRYLLDHSRPGTAKWCSMATCGNRIKARNHARRAKMSTAD